MDTLYFIGFCFLIGFGILWGYLNDDYAEFNGDGGKKKFSMKKPDVKKASDADEKDTPRANLL